VISIHFREIQQLLRQFDKVNVYTTIGHNCVHNCCVVTREFLDQRERVKLKVKEIPGLEKLLNCLSLCIGVLAETISEGYLFFDGTKNWQF